MASFYSIPSKEVVFLEVALFHSSLDFLVKLPMEMVLSSREDGGIFTYSDLEYKISHLPNHSFLILCVALEHSSGTSTVNTSGDVSEGNSVDLLLFSLRLVSKRCQTCPRQLTLFFVSDTPLNYPHLKSKPYCLF